MITVEQIKAVLSEHSRREIQNPALTRAGVLILLFLKSGELHFLLTRRTQDVEHHKGQISFPGGSRDRADHSIVETALRESEEEIGLPRSVVQVLGLFDDYETPSGFAITPVVGYVPELPPLGLNTSEVTEMLEVPVTLFTKKVNERVETRQIRGKLHDVYFYRYGSHEIWGATAAMIRAFLQTLHLVP
jgi:8-oxo-dGTP pyrophosphatase MutT (NUDIX family)